MNESLNRDSRPRQTEFRQTLTFQLGEETYGVDILGVQEIRGWVPVTRVPRSQPHVLGVLNLRGSIVPIVDMRVRFGLADAAFTPATVVIVLSIEGPARRREVGLVVDSVSDVVDVPAEAMKQVPGLASSAESDAIAGLATLDDRMLILLDVDALTAAELEATDGPSLAGAA